MADFIQNPQQAEAQPVASKMPPPEMISQGPAQGTGLSVVEQDPRETPDSDASKEEQEQYEDLFLRLMSAVHDVRSPNKKGGKPFADQVIQMLATKDKEPHESIGVAAGLVLSQMVGMAKRNKVEYLPDVIREAGMDLVGELYMIADKSGAIKGLPEEGSEGYQAVINQSILEAVKFYGENLISTGQTNQQEHMNELQHQMQREADSGELEGWGMEEFDLDTRNQIASKLGGSNGA